MRILVIADDITGAAEMAGIAHRMGCKVRFSTVPTPFVGEEEVMVWATDTRSVAREEAVAITLYRKRKSDMDKLLNKTEIQRTFQSPLR